MSETLIYQTKFDRNLKGVGCASNPCQVPQDVGTNGQSRLHCLAPKHTSEAAAGIVMEAK